MFQEPPRPGCAPSRWRGAAAAAAVVAALGVNAAARPPQSPAGAVSPAGAPAAAANLPAARSVIDRHIEASGGRRAWLGYSSSHLKGTFSIPANGLTGTVENFAAKPNKALLRISLPGLGEIVEGFDGTRGWRNSPMTGPSLLEGKELEEKRALTAFDAELKPEAHFTSMTTVGRTEFDGRPCFKLSLIRKTGGEDLEFYDIATGLRAGSIVTRQTEMGAIRHTTIERDYRRFGKLLQPATLRVEASGVQQVITVTAIEFDNVAASVFEMPETIKALIK